MKRENDRTKTPKTKTEKLIEAFIKFGAVIGVFVTAISLYNLLETHAASGEVKAQTATIEAFKMEAAATQTAALVTSSEVALAQRKQLDEQSARLILLESPVFSATTEKFTRQQLLSYVNTQNGVSRLVSSDYSQAAIEQRGDDNEYVVIVFTNLGRTPALNFQVADISYAPVQSDDVLNGASLRPIQSIAPGNSVALLVFVGSNIVEVDPLDDTGIAELLVSYTYEDRFETTYNPNDIVAFDLDFEDENGNEIAAADVETSTEIGSGTAGFITNAIVDIIPLDVIAAQNPSNLAVPSIVVPSVMPSVILPIDESQIELAQP